MRRSVVLLGALVVVALIAVPAALAGTGGNKTGQACYKGMYVNYQDPLTGHPFASQDACVSFVANGGTLVPEADVSVVFQQPSTVTFPGFSLSGDLAVHNGGPVAVTVHLSISLAWGGPFAATWVGTPSCFWNLDSTGRPVGATCSRTLQPGETFIPVSLAGDAGALTFGAGAITSSSSPDPNTTNNTVFFSL